MLTGVDRVAWVLLLTAWFGAGACKGEECTPGESRACSMTLDGGFTQSGFQACGSRAEWSACVSVGGCTAPGGAPLALYSRCTATEQCGPEGCAVCGHYAGVENPSAFGLCYAYCQTNAECEPTTASRDVTARCVLGQCTLACHASSQCPRDTQCLPWSTGAAPSTFAGFDGLCE